MDDKQLPGRIPPHNDDAERAVLGALLVAPDRIAEVAEILQSEDFYARRHQLVFASLVDLGTRGAAVDLVTVSEALRAAGTFQAIGGKEVLIELALSVTSAAHIAHHAHIVAETALLRRLIASSTQVIEEAYATRPDGENVRLLLDDCEQRMFQLARHTAREGADPVQNVLREAFLKIDARTHRELTGLTTGFYELDEKLCGLNKGDLVILAARPSMGKTALALNIIEAAALSRPEHLVGRPPVVLLFSLEMGKESIIQRMLCSRARVDAHKLRTGRIPDDDYSALSQAAGEISHTAFFIDDTPGLSVMSMRGRARRLKAKHGLDLIVLDYLQLMTHPKAESRQMEVSEISRSLKALARELEVPVVALAQLSRAVEGKDRTPRGRPLLSDLRESGSIEQDADVVMMLYRAEYYATTDEERREQEGKATVIIAKHRNGPTGEVNLQFRASIMRFENPAPSAAEPIYA